MVIDKAARDLRAHWGPALARSEEEWQPNSEIAAATLARILSTPDQPRPAPATPPRWTWVWRIAVGGVSATIAVIATLTMIPNPAPAHDVTPPPLTYHAPEQPVAAAPLLEQIADSTRSTAAGASPGGPDSLVEHLRIVSWNLNSQIDGRRITSAVVPTDTETWLRADNSGRSIRRQGTPIFADADDRRDWKDQRALSRGNTPVAETYPPGGYQRLWAGRPPTEVPQLEKWLREINKGTDESAQTLLAITDLFKERVLDPSERAAVLLVLARLPDLQYAGITTDRADRSGEAFFVTSDVSGLPTRYTLIIDRHTGILLAQEQMLLTDTGRLNVEAPAVVDFDTYVTADWVPDIP
ncbi:hypothetical protein BDK92_2759 [Micromonospora pisi]|uniref:CU044_5270 family protein n=1 Tax=Micromonospora pisi TaxID=589240 RepID=A0A495JJD9_9ACTN|nr:CU044_5270 family protein [Micromonospora pisi]RKR88432.1 hypothetical protein BDK92_2759 [Micromonospora pisi]